MKKTKKSAAINLIFFVATLVVNFLGAIGYIFGNSQSDISDKFKTVLTPAGYAFSIWGLIYTLIPVSFVMVFFFKDKDDLEEIIGRISPFFILSSIFNIAWIFLYSYGNMLLSIIAIVLLAISLLVIVYKLNGVNTEGILNIYPITFGIYAGWVCLASFINFANYVVQLTNGSVLGPNDTGYGLLLLFILFVTGVIVCLTSRNAAFLLPYIHAALAIKVEVSKVNPDFPVLVLYILMLLAAGLVIYSFVY
ncbi:MAG: TspO/MBR family protein [Finegoldia sp.]|nr:TspO/MBR family protein [Finegoldia sp.]